MGSRAWLWPVKILVTAIALVVICRSIPWRDRVTLLDGHTAILVEDCGKTCWIKRDHSGSNVRRVPGQQIASIEPGVATLLGRVRPGWLLAHIACIGTSAVLLIARWRFMMSDLSHAPSTLWCGVIWARSQVINLLPLSQVGGDLYRIERTFRTLGGTTTAIGIVVTERIVGFAALLAVAGTAAVYCSITHINLVPNLPLSASVFVICSLLLICAVGPLRHYHGKVLSGPIIAITRRLRPLAIPLRRLAHSPRRLVIVSVASLAIHVLAPLSFITVDRALAINAPLWCYLVAVPVIGIAQYLPIHIAGIGILEGGLWLFLSRWAGTTPADVMALSAVIRILGLLWVAMLAPSFIAHCRPVNNPVSITGPADSGLMQSDSIPSTTQNQPIGEELKTVSQVPT